MSHAGIEANVLYVIDTGNEPEYGWSPDGIGMYWYDPNVESFSDFMDDCDDFQTQEFASPREFDDFRYGPM